MLGVRLEADMQARLDRLADVTKRTKSSLAKEALDLFLDAEEERLLRMSARERYRLAADAELTASPLHSLNEPAWLP